MDGLKVTREKDGLPLLHWCELRGEATDAIVEKLVSQLGVEWNGLRASDMQQQREPRFDFE